jgi:tRNA-dihydrouridine synthase B
VKLPVVVNGDIVTVEGAKSALEKSGADAVMVGRGAYGRPWFLRQVMEYLRDGRKLPSPEIQDQMNTVLEHYQAMLSHYGTDTGLKIARKHLGWYSKGLPGSADFRTRIMQITDPKVVMETVRGFYEPLVGQELPEDVLGRGAPGADEREAA